MDPSIAALNAQIDGLGKQIDRLLDAGKEDHDTLTRLAEEMKQAFLEVKSLRAGLEKYRENYDARARACEALCAARGVKSESDIRAEERTRADEKEWQRKVLERLDSLEKTRTHVQSQATGLGKLVLAGTGGGGLVKLFEWLSSFWGKTP